jgi:hypothetical protein
MGSNTTSISRLTEPSAILTIIVQNQLIEGADSLLGLLGASESPLERTRYLADQPTGCAGCRLRKLPNNTIYYRRNFGR